MRKYAPIDKRMRVGGHHQLLRWFDADPRRWTNDVELVVLRATSVTTMVDLAGRVGLISVLAKKLWEGNHILKCLDGSKPGR